MKKIQTLFAIGALLLAAAVPVSAREHSAAEETGSGAAAAASAASTDIATTASAAGGAASTGSAVAGGSASAGVETAASAASAGSSAETAAADGAASAAETAGKPSGATPGELWERANAAYVDNDFHGAIALYRAIEAQGLVSAKLYYNLANAYFKQEQPAEAILYYRRALRLAPGDEDVRHNLSVAEARTKDTIERIPEFFLTTWVRSLRSTMSATAWTVLSLVLLTATLLLGLFYLLAQRLTLRKAGFYGMLAAGLLFVAATSFAAGQRREQLDRSEAVVMAASAAVKSSPDRSATDLFVLHAGTTLRVTNRLDDWCEITIADGKKGWTEARNLETI